MNFVIKSHGVAMAKRPAHLCPLAELLRRLGLRRKANQSLIPRRGLSLQKMWDLFDEAKNLYRRKVAQLHPDRGGAWRVCAELNSVWTNIKRLFMRRGVGA